MWPNFRSPLTWDMFAISAYASVSLLFWFIGLIPDLATLRDSAKSRFQKLVYGALALGWNGSAKAWQRYMRAYLLLAALSFPLVLSVHSTIAMDFAVSQVPGWNNTVMPPYFVAGAVFAGFAMVLLLAIPLRRAFGLHALITMRHLDNAAKLMLGTGMIVVYGYGVELFYAWYSGVEFEVFMAYNRVLGADHWWAFWALILCNGVIPQLLWIKKVRTSPLILFLLSIVINIGMWLERFVIVITSLHRDFLPSSWGMYAPTRWDIAMFIGTIGFFGLMMCLFLRFVPMIAGFEIRELLHRKKGAPH
jgi:molybdopterin-containing oxidoreductase family membrane subunit